MGFLKAMSGRIRSSLATKGRSSSGRDVRDSSFLDGLLDEVANSQGRATNDRVTLGASQLSARVSVNRASISELMAGPLGAYANRHMPRENMLNRETQLVELGHHGAIEYRAVTSEFLKDFTKQKLAWQYGGDSPASKASTKALRFLQAQLEKSEKEIADIEKQQKAHEASTLRIADESQRFRRSETEAMANLQSVKFEAALVHTSSRHAPGVRNQRRIHRLREKRKMLKKDIKERKKFPFMSTRDVHEQVWATLLKFGIMHIAESRYFAGAGRPRGNWAEGLPVP